MKILVAGCSISAGTGFPLEINEPGLWCNQISNKMNAQLTNVSIPGYDNPGIFLNALEKFTTDHYDLILIQFSGFNRLVLSPNIHGRILITNTPTNLSLWGEWFDQKEFHNLQKTLTLVNGGMEHWNRLIRIIFSLQNLRKKLGLNLKIINGLIPWDQSLFAGKDSKFLWEYFDLDRLPDTDIEKFKDQVRKQIQKIDLDLWINPFESLLDLQIDAAPLDNHPGWKSHDRYTEAILKSI